MCVYVCVCVCVCVCARARARAKAYLSCLAKRCLKLFEVSESKISSTEFTIAQCNVDIFIHYAVSQNTVSNSSRLSVSAYIRDITRPAHYLDKIRALAHILTKVIKLAKTLCLQVLQRPC